MLFISASHLHYIAAKLLQKRNNFLASCQYRSHFGIDCHQTEIVWNQISVKIYKIEPKHLFWGLIFLKFYSSEEVHSTLCKTSRKTYRYWSWNVVEAIAHLKVVSLLKIFVTYFFILFL